MKNNIIYRMTHGVQDEDSRSMMRLAFGIVGIWFLLAFIGGMMGIFNQPGVPPLSVGLFVLVPIAGFTFAYGVSPRFRHAVDGIPLWFITIAHTWRFVGLGFVIGAMANVLPRQFGFPEGLGDIATAALCLPLARALRDKGRSPRLQKAFIAWNVFGLIDLLSAISLGILYSPSSFGVQRTDISTAIMTAFPINMIPTFFVPLFILLHMLALKRSSELA
ncbi:MAG: hypothetical protein ACM3MD_01795 [Betaproteobacteria bacterium]